VAVLQGYLSRRSFRVSWLVFPAVDQKVFESEKGILLYKQRKDFALFSLIKQFI
jgi:hypothetical protein